MEETGNLRESLKWWMRSTDAWKKSNAYISGFLIESLWLHVY
jgi:hypothetical protein